ncbi:MAG: diguanylate cyclase [Alphaproteobacteria bacterium]|nr:diguanylate cyclase [Alphaproteobacteria bacterium]
MFLPGFDNFLDLITYFSPELIGSLLLIYSLKYLRHFSLAAEGTMTLSYAFFLLAVKNAVALFWYFFIGEALPSFFLALIFIAFQTSAAIFMILAGLQIARIPYVSKKLMPYISTGAILFVIYVMIVGSHNALKMVLPSLILCLSSLILAFCYFKETYLHKTSSLKWMFIGFLTLSFWHFFKVLPWGQEFNWGLEVTLYSFLLFCIFYTSTLVIQQQFELLEYDAFSNKSRLRLILQSAPFPTFISRLKDNKILLINEEAADFFKFDLKGNYSLYDCFQDESIRRRILEKLDKTPFVRHYEVQLKKSSKNTKTLELSARIIDFENEISLFIAFQDITEQKQKEALLFEQATEDALTTCYNRRQFMTLAEKEVSRFWRYHTPFAFLMIDVDDFKNINDTYGHGAGDMVLKSIGICWKKIIRSSDILGRVGGDEFALVLHNTDAKKAILIAKRLQEAVSLLDLTTKEGTSLPVKISIGISLSSSMNDLEKTMKLADEALYASKKEGKDKITLSGSTILESTSSSNEKEVISQAIDNVVEETMEEINTLLSSMNKPKILNLSKTLKSAYLEEKDKKES